jgi:hypothetical protein
VGRRAASRLKAGDKTLLIAPTSWHGVDLVSLPAVKKLVLDFVRQVAG